MDRIMIFGLGKVYTKFRQGLEVNSKVAKIVALIDNDVNKQGTIIDGVTVCSPNEALALAYDYILVLGKFDTEIIAQLRNMGVKKERIVTLRETNRYSKWFRAKHLQIFCNEKTWINMLETPTRRPIALFGSLIYAGGPLALLQMAQILKKNHYDVVVVVEENGPSLKEFIQHDIPVVIDPNAFHGLFFENTWISVCSAIILNGLQLAPFMNQLPSNVPIIWWLHDPEEYYRVKQFSFESLSLKNVDVYAVSELAWQPLKKRFPYLSKQLLFYGIPDMKTECIASRFDGKLVFAVLGKVHSIKGQDIFLKAVSLMSAEKRNQCEFWVVGNKDTAFATKLQETAMPYDNFKILGEFDRAGMNELFKRISVVVTPSRADMMPTANVEAMMYGIPCIISENAGTAQFISNGIDGLISKSNDPHDLAAKMEWVVDNRCRLAEMGKKSMAIYKNNFTMEVFEKNILAIMDKNINKRI